MVAAVVVQCRAEVVGAESMGSPRKPGFGGLPCDYELARGVYRVSGKIKTDTVEAVVGRHGGIRLPRTEMVECQLRLWKEVMP